jgi:rubrerythrin
VRVFEGQDLSVCHQIEENGERFYRQAAQGVQDKDASRLFEHLADEEVKHRKIFEGMLPKTETYSMGERYPGEYLEYLGNDLDDKVVFNKRETDRELTDVKDTPSAIDFAMHREIGAILYFLEIKNLVSKDQQSSIDRIVDEERKHFSLLSQMRKNLAEPSS